MIVEALRARNFQVTGAVAFVTEQDGTIGALVEKETAG